MTQVTAQVILQEPGGPTLLKSETPPTDEEIANAQPSQETIAEVRQKLQALGFDVGASGAMTLTVSADKATFETVFHTSLAKVKDPKTGKPQWSIGAPIVIGDDLKPWVADVILSTEPEFFP